MKKFIPQLLLVIALLFCAWFALSRVNWIAVFQIEHITGKTEEKLGDLFWKMYERSDQEITNKSVTIPVDSLLTRICEANYIDKSRIKLHIIQSEEVNAFALPNRHLVINSALILDARNESEIMGVIGHEIAHMELDHVMKKLVKEIGFSVLISMTTGNGGSTSQIKQAVKLLSSTAYDRKLESAADKKAVEYLINSDISPVYFADFIARLGGNDDSSIESLTWISTHPDSEERAKNILESKNEYPANNPHLLSCETWKKVKASLKESNN